MRALLIACSLLLASFFQAHAQTYTVGVNLPAAGSTVLKNGESVLIPFGQLCTNQFEMTDNTSIVNNGNWAPNQLTVPATASVTNTGRINTTILSIAGTLQNAGTMEALYSVCAGQVFIKPKASFRTYAKCTISGGFVQNCGAFLARDFVYKNVAGISACPP